MLSASQSSALFLPLVIYKHKKAKLQHLLGEKMCAVAFFIDLSLSLDFASFWEVFFLFFFTLESGYVQSSVSSIFFHSAYVELPLFLATACTP